MNVINKNIEMISVFTPEGEPKPIRFRVSNEMEELQVYKIEKIISKGMQVINKQSIWIFNCLIIMNGLQRLCEIRYILAETKWILYKI